MHKKGVGQRTLRVERRFEHALGTTDIVPRAGHMRTLSDGGAASCAACIGHSEREVGEFRSDEGFRGHDCDKRSDKQSRVTRRECSATRAARQAGAVETCGSAAMAAPQLAQRR